MKRFSSYFMLLTACMLAILFIGCSQQPSDDSSKSTKPTEITFLTMQLRPTFDQYFLDLFKKYEILHPDIKIKWLDYPYQNYDTKIMTAFMSKNPPDVINLATDSIAMYADGEHILPLKEFLSQEVFDSYFPNLLIDGCLYKEAIYALPWYTTGEITFYNTKLFEEAGLSESDFPETYEEIPEIARRIKEKTNAFGFFPLYTEMGSFRYYFLEAGVPLLDETGTKAAFNTPRAVEVVKFWTDLYKHGLVPSEALTAMHRRPVELYKAGRLAILNTGAVFLKQVKADSPEVYENTAVGTKLHWKAHEIYFSVLHVLSVANKSSHKKEAAEFAAFVTNAENQLEFCKLTTILPSSKKSLEDPYFTNVEDTPEGHARKISAEQMGHAGIMKIPPQSRKLFQVFDDIAEKICLGKTTPEEGVAFAEKQWNEILQEK